MPSLKVLQKSHGALHHFTATMAPVPVSPDHSDPDTKAPVIAANYTRIEGGLILSVAVHHNFMDGTGVGLLVKLWAEFTQGGATSANTFDPSEPVSRQNRLLAAARSGQGPPSTPSFPFGELLLKHPESRLRSNFLAEIAANPLQSACPITPKTSSRIFSVSKARIAETKEALKESIAQISLLTTNSILCALLWTCVTRIRMERLRNTGMPVDLQTHSKLGFAVNGRQCLNSSFVEKAYLGNVNLYGLAQLPISALEEATYGITPHACNSLAPIIEAIGEATARITASHIVEVLDFEKETQNMEDIIPGWGGIGSFDWSVTNWTHLGLHACDFGRCLGGDDGASGTPIFVRPPFAEFDGLVIVLPRAPSGSDEQEDIEMVVLLVEDDIEALEKDSVWRRWGKSLNREI
jgi:trichothecene 3-O-acetyltransferase